MPSCSVLFNELCLPPSFLLAVLVSAGARTQTSVSAQQSAPLTRATRAARRRAKDEVEGCVSMAEVDVDSRPKTSTLIDGDSRASQG